MKYFNSNQQSKTRSVCEKIEFFKQAISALKCWNYSIHFIDWISLQKIWVFRAIHLSIEVLMVINSFHSSNRFVKVFVFQASCLRSFEVNQFISSTESVCEEVEVFKKAFSAVKIFSFSKWLHRRNLVLLFCHAKVLLKFH